MAVRGRVGSVGVRFGVVRQAWLGRVWIGKARYGRHGTLCLGQAGSGLVCQGWAWQARFGPVWQGWVRFGKARQAWLGQER